MKVDAESQESSCSDSSNSCSSKSRETQCDLCPYKSNRRSNLERHLRNMHTSVAGKDLECCSKTFKNKAQLREHRTKEHKGGYACTECLRSFCRRALLKRHLSVHSGYKEYACSECDYATSHKSNLDRHITHVHFRDETPATAATPKNLATKGTIHNPPRNRFKSSMSPHSKPQLNFNLLTTKIRLCAMPYKCPTCQSSFDNQQEYTVHLSCCLLEYDNRDESTLSAAIILSQMLPMPYVFDDTIIAKLEVAEFVEVVSDNCL